MITEKTDLTIRDEQGRDLLFLVVRNGDLNSSVEKLLKLGADPGTTDKDGVDLLMLAAGKTDVAINYHHQESALLLLRVKGSLRQDESELLVDLVETGNADLLRAFLEAGASIPPPGKRKEPDPCCTNPPDPGKALKTAARKEDPSILKLLGTFPDATGASEPDFLAAAAEQAAASGQIINLKHLVETLGADPDILIEGGDIFRSDVRYTSPREADRSKPVRGHTALSRALEEGHTEVVRYLLTRGVTITGRTRNGEPPLTFAVTHQDHDMLRLFLKHKPPTELVDTGTLTALHHAAENDDAIALRLLLAHGANPDTKTAIGETPLDLARKKDAQKAIEILTSHKR